HTAPAQQPADAPPGLLATPAQGSSTTPARLALVVLGDELLPRNPASLRAVESPLAHARAGDEQRPAGLLHHVAIRMLGVVPPHLRQLDAMRAPRAGKLDRWRLAKLAPVDAARGDRVLDVRAIQQDRAPRPGVIVQRPIVIVAQELMQVDVEDRIAGDEPPALEVGALCTADDEVRWPTGNVPIDQAADHSGSL